MLKFGAESGMGIYSIFMGIVLGAAGIYLLFGDLKILDKLSGGLFFSGLD